MSRRFWLVCVRKAVPRMRTVLKLLIVLLLLVASLAAELQAQRAPARAAFRAPPVAFTATRLPISRPSSALVLRGVRPSTIRDVSTVGENRFEYAAIGAGVGFLGGAVLGSEIANRCRPVTDARCTRKGRQLKYSIGFGVLGAFVGGAAGAIVASR